MDNIEKQTAEGADFGSNLEILEDILRILTLLEQRLNQVARKNYHSRSQYPNLFFEIEKNHFPNAFRIHLKKLYNSMPHYHTIKTFKVPEDTSLYDDFKLFVYDMQNTKDSFIEKLF